jgi:multiple sugar transport system permease protein
MRRDLPKRLTVSILSVALACWVLMPLYWMLTASLKDPVEIFSYPPLLLFQPSLRAYSELLFTLGWGKYFLNSLMMSFGSTLLALGLGLPAAYALARLPMKRKEFTATTIIMVRMIPPLVMILPFFFMMGALNLRDTYPGLIMIYALFDLPFVVWIMRGFIEQLPRDMEEAAMIDGCTPLQAFLRIALPMSAPGLAATITFCFVQSWNEFPMAYTITGEQTRTIPVALAPLIGLQRIWWNQVFAVGVLCAIPALIMAYAVQKYWTRGLTLGLVK